MELLDEMLDKKVERERLNGLDPASATTSTQLVPAAGSAKPADSAAKGQRSSTARLCWLCNRNSSLRFRLQGVIFLCFNCFRISYLSLLLPIIDTPARRSSDAAFLKLIYNIEEERNASMGSLGEDSLASTYGEIIEPQRASFVMNSSMIRQRRVEEEQRRISATGHGGDAGPITSTKVMWSCPQCTFLNAALARECEACGFVNPGTVLCPVCKVHCPIGTSASAVSSKGNRCTNGEPHRMWNCRECGGLNTLDGDRCALCHQPRYWACSHCTALHHIARGEDGLRYCPTCGNYNTPEDVLDGQAKIDKEAQYAELVTAHRGKADGASPPASSTAPSGSEIVFGVNDAQTLEERARQKEIANNEKRLQSRLNRLHISRNVQKTDGNCLFSALANQLFGQPRLHYLVRSLATAYMNNHPEDYAILFDGETEWRSYLAAMKEQGTWGDELCLNAAARCFHVNIHVITSDPERWHIVFQYEQLGHSKLRTKEKGAKGVANSEAPEMGSPKPKAGVPQSPPVYEGVSLFLAYLAPVHYDDITPSPVKPLMLGELLSGELNNRVKRKQYRNSAVKSPEAAPATQAPLNLAARTSVTSAAPVKVRTLSSDNLMKSYIESSGAQSPTTAAPAVPRSRPLSSTNMDAHGPQEPPRPPTAPPPNFRPPQ